jgi:hypothetical protein
VTNDYPPVDCAALGNGLEANPVAAEPLISPTSYFQIERDAARAASVVLKLLSDRDPMFLMRYCVRCDDPRAVVAEMRLSASEIFEIKRHAQALFAACMTNPIDGRQSHPASRVLCD